MIEWGQMAEFFHYNISEPDLITETDLRRRQAALLAISMTYISLI